MDEDAKQISSADSLGVNPQRRNESFKSPFSVGKNQDFPEVNGHFSLFDADYCLVYGI